MQSDFVIVLISDQPVRRKSISRYSKYTDIVVLEYSTETMSMENIVKEFYTKFSKTNSKMIVLYDGQYYDKWAALLSNSSTIVPIYTNYYTRLPPNIQVMRPSYSALCRMISLFCMYLSMDIFIHVGDTVGLLDQMHRLHYYSDKTMIKCKDEDTIDDIVPILNSTNKRVSLIINSCALSKASILSIIDSVDADVYILLFCNYRMQSVTKNVVQIYDPFSIDAVLDTCNRTKQYTSVESYLNSSYYNLDVLQLNDSYLRDNIDDTDQIAALHNSMYKYSSVRDTSIARKYKLVYNEYDDRLIVWEECLNSYNDSLHYSSDDMIGCRLYSTILSTDGYIVPSAQLDTSTPISVNRIDTGVRKYNRY